MPSPSSTVLARRVLIPLVAVGLTGAAACGDNLEPVDSDDGGDAGTPACVGDAVSEGIAIEGLECPVDVYFDASGILHVRCESDHDCFAVQGYYHAAHRFIQMDLRRRLARGKLSAVAAGGQTLLDMDMQQRHMMTARDGTPLEEQLYASADPATRAAIDAYTVGVNAWLADAQEGRNGAALPAEYSFFAINQGAVFDDWEPLDSVACILPLVDSLTNFHQTDTVAGAVVAALGPETAADLFSLRPPSESAILPAAEAAARAQGGADARRAALDVMRQAHDRLAGSRSLLEKALRRMPGASLEKNAVGSNNWVVAPSHTSGGALLANDPHLALSHPAIWYLVHLDSKSAGRGGELHMAGASFAGLPGLVLGQNEDIAWGATTTFFDSSDVYVETLNEAGDAVVFQGMEVPLAYKEYSFEVAGQAEPTVVRFPIVPHHGPLISVDGTQGLSVRWSGHDADTDINFFLRLATAGSVDEARAALESVTTAGQNFVVIDRGGNIGWFPYNRLPSRPWLSSLPSWLPLPGDGSVDAEWGDPIPYADLPQAINPPAGFLATANNDMTGALRDGDTTNDDLPYVQGFMDEGYRHERIVQRLAARSDHDLASMQSIQADDHSLLGELLRDPIVESLDAPPADPDAQAVLAALSAWTDFECPTGLAGIASDSAPDPATAVSARGCAAFHVTWARLRDLAFKDELAAEGLDVTRVGARPSALIFLLTEDDFDQSYWDDVSTTDVVETRAQIVDRALTEAGALLRARTGNAEPPEWLWGRIHTLTLRADLFSNFVDDFDHPSSGEPFANDGGLFTVDVAPPRNELGLNNQPVDFNQSAGPSMRFACQANTPGVSCTIELPGGQRHDRASSFYNSMFGDWLTNRPVPLGFDIDAVAEGAVETVRFGPP